MAISHVKKEIKDSKKEMDDLRKKDAKNKDEFFHHEEIYQTGYQNGLKKAIDLFSLDASEKYKHKTISDLLNQK